MRTVLNLVLGLLLTLGTAIADDPPGAIDPGLLKPEWDEETVKLFEAIPVQEDGRVKPMRTYADYKCLRIRGAKVVRIKLKGGGKRDISASEWMLDTLFYPEVAKHYPSLLVTDKAILTAIGITPAERRKMRDRYSYAELFPGGIAEKGARSKLAELRGAMAEKMQANPDYKSDRLEKLIGQFASAVSEYEYILNALKFATPVSVDPNSFPETLLSEPGATSIKSSYFLEQLPKIREFVQTGEDSEGLTKVFNQYMFAASSAAALPWYPPMKEDESKWLSPGEVLNLGLQQDDLREWSLPKIKAVEELVALSDDRAAFKGKLGEINEDIVGAATARGEYSNVPLELAYHRGKFVSYSKYSFVLVFLMFAISWLSPGARWSNALYKVAMFAVALPAGLLFTSLVFRCLILGRAPVSGLYETIPFITMVVVLVGFAMEIMVNRTTRFKALVMPIICCLAVVGLFLADRFEIKEGTDTMQPLQAVLNSNYWLWTHVTSVTIGYSAVLLATGFSYVYIVARIFDLRRLNADLFKVLTKCVYGIVCFGLIFSLVGTVLGGVWANDSWGRFWGWDPKENGALMIVLWFLIILHARLGGYIKEFGIHMMSIINGMIVVFSWWHTNQLGVGLHSYGETEGILKAVWTFYKVQGVFLVVGFFVWLVSRALDKETRAAKARGGSDEIADAKPEAG